MVNLEFLCLSLKRMTSKRERESKREKVSWGDGGVGTRLNEGID